jgi:hypothetical protein
MAIMVAPVDNPDENQDGRVSTGERLRFWSRIWRAAPRSVRRSIVAVVGFTLLALGMMLVVLPGPFTLPLVLAGLAVLGSEFAWASRLLEQGKSKLSAVGGSVRRRLRR